MQVQPASKNQIKFLLIKADHYGGLRYQVREKPLEKTSEGAPKETSETPKEKEAVDRVVRHRRYELLVQTHDQVAGPLASHPVDSRASSLPQPSSTIRPRKAVCSALTLAGAPGEGS